MNSAGISGGISNCMDSGNNSEEGIFLEHGTKAPGITKTIQVSVSVDEG